MGYKLYNDYTMFSVRVSKRFGSLRTVGVGWAGVTQQTQHIVGKSLVEAFRCPL